jgi:uncharacterized protein (TIGR02466 family)
LIQSLFITPVYQKSTSYSLDKKQKQFLKSCKRKNNSFNISSLNSYVLDLPIFKKFKKQIMSEVENYVYNTLLVDKSVKIFMTQSWFNWTKNSEQHHRHEHPNSFVSGVYYVDVDPEIDRIYFNKEIRTDLRLVATEYNDYNSESYYLPVKNKDILLFPSDLNHHVATKEDKKERISLAFNTFLKGKMGDQKGLWELKL